MMDRFLELLERIRYKDWTFTISTGSRLYLQVRILQVRLGKWRGRKWLLSEHMTDSEFVATCFKAVLTAEEHECREAFTYRGQAVFGPHLDVNIIANVLANHGRQALDVREEA